MARVKKHRYKLFLILAVIWMIIIFVNSSLVGRTSSGLSELIIDVLVKITLPMGDSAFFIGLRKILQGDGFHIFIRKFAHFVEFGILGVFLTAGFGVFKNLVSRIIKRGIFAASAAVLYAITDEIHQLFVPGRVGAVTDVLIDAAGIVIFVGIMILFMLKEIKDA